MYKVHIDLTHLQKCCISEKTQTDSLSVNLRTQTLWSLQTLEQELCGFTGGQIFYLVSYFGFSEGLVSVVHSLCSKLSETTVTSYGHKKVIWFSKGSPSRPFTVNYVSSISAHSQRRSWHVRCPLCDVSIRRPLHQHRIKRRIEQKGTFCWSPDWE